MGYLKQRILRLVHDEGGFWNLLIPAATSLISGIIGGKKTKQAAQKDAAGARLQDILPKLMPLLQQMQQANQQSYQLQMQRYQQADPFRQALLSMSQGLLPTHQQPPPPFQIPQVPPK